MGGRRDSIDMPAWMAIMFVVIFLLIVAVVSKILAQDERTVITPTSREQGRYETYNFQENTWERGIYYLDLNAYQEKEESYQQYDQDEVQEWADGIKHMYEEAVQGDSDM